MLAGLPIHDAGKDNRGCLASASGFIVSCAVITQVRMVSNPQIQKRAILYVHSIALLVCCFYKLQGENVTCRGGFNICSIQHVSRRSSDSYIAATLDGPASCRIYSSNARHSSSKEWDLASLVTGHGW